MKSGLKDRNNQLVDVAVVQVSQTVSMKSGLKDRNNRGGSRQTKPKKEVSMKSGLKDRNNGSPRKAVLTSNFTSVCERSAPQSPATTLC